MAGPASSSSSPTGSILARIRITSTSQRCGCRPIFSCGATAKSCNSCRAQGARGTPEGCAADKLADDALVGKTEAEVIGLLQGCAWRLGERDGQQFPGTMDYNPQRRTLGVKAGKVVWVRRG